MVVARDVQSPNAPGVQEVVQITVSAMVVGKDASMRTVERALKAAPTSARHTVAGSGARGASLVLGMVLMMSFTAISLPGESSVFALPMLLM